VILIYKSKHTLQSGIIEAIYKLLNLWNLYQENLKIIDNRLIQAVHITTVNCLNDWILHHNQSQTVISFSTHNYRIRTERLKSEIKISRVSTRYVHVKMIRTMYAGFFLLRPKSTFENLSRLLKK
jgi:hypothetical protein